MPETILPWEPGSFPLMLAPMQGLTNRAMRRAYIETVHPETVFTEFVRVSAVSRKRIAKSDRVEAAATFGGVPLVVQLIGHGVKPLAHAAQEVVGEGAQHLNLNLGCPYGRHTTGRTGGEMLRSPELLPELLAALREVVPGSLSIKLRAGYDDLRQVFSLLQLFEASGVDFLILHPRTVVQKYTGHADHTVTAEVAAATRLPLIANGDINSAAIGWQVRKECGVAGLMLGRGAIADPLLFERLRGNAPAEVVPEQALPGLARLLLKVLPEYRATFYGDVQVLHKLKGVFAAIEAEELQPLLRRLKKIKQLDTFCDELRQLAGDCPDGTLEA